MRVKIYQINSNRDKAHFRFSNLAETTKLMQGNGVDSSLYDEVFNAELGTGDLEEIYTKFNIERHPLHRGDSLSVSDVVVTDQGAYFCDSSGFEKIDFDESKTQNYYFTNLPVGGFFLYEKEAPAGFEKDDNYYYFEITEDGDEVTVENKAGVGFVNKPTTGELEITKTDVATGKLLPKAGFRIKDADGKVVAEGYTDENGIAKFKLRAGKYTYEEFDAPEGYIIDTTPHEFEITENGQVIKAEMTNVKEATPDTPQTGDSSMSGFFIGLGALALGGIAACVILFLKRKKDDGDDE